MAPEHHSHGIRGEDRDGPTTPGGPATRDRPATPDGRTAPLGTAGPSWVPRLVRDVDVAAGLPRLEPTAPAMGGDQQAWVLVRLFDEPLGAVSVAVPADGLDPSGLVAAMGPELVAAIRRRLEDGGVGWTGSVPVGGCRPAREPPFLASRAVVIERGPQVTAVICTRDRPEGMARCLASLQAQSYPKLSLLVVDNGSTTDATRAAAGASRGPHPVGYVYEPKPGLSHARNRAMAQTTTEVVAWIDDDEIADPHWILELARGFVETTEAGAVCGVMVPGELETQAQVWFEDYGGHSKGRGFTVQVFSPETAELQSPLFPLPPFGTGGNFAIRRSTFDRLGRFDPALGVGTRTMGAEDTRALTDILLAGGTVRYQPTAVTHHFHRREYEAFARQMRGYGVGLTAFYTSLVLDHPTLVVALARLAPMALRAMRDTSGPRLGGLGPDFPAEVLHEHRRGLAAGPAAYLSARRTARRLARREPDRPGWLDEPVTPAGS